MEMKSLSERFPLGKNLQQIFYNKVCFISNKMGDGSIAMSV